MADQGSFLCCAERVAASRSSQNVAFWTLCRNHLSTHECSSRPSPFTRPSRCEWWSRAVRPGLHPQRPDPGRVKTWPLSRPTRTPRPRIPSRLGEDLVHGDGKRAQCRSLPAPPGPPLAVPRLLLWEGNAMGRTRTAAKRQRRASRKVIPADHSYFPVQNTDD